MDEVGRWFFSMRYISTSEAPALHKKCVISKNSCKQEELNELIVYLMHEEIVE